MGVLERAVREALSKSGVEIGGDRPWDVKVHDDRLYRRVLTRGTLGLGEAYMDGWWDCDLLDEACFRVLSALGDRSIRSPSQIALSVLSRLFNLQSKRRAFRIGEAHYDIGNDLFRAMLDRRLNYSCAYWKSASDLEEAQEAKLELVCEKLGLSRGMTVLDIGCGWGSLLKYAAETRGVKGVGITVSKEQAELARRLCEGLPIEIRLRDYRDLDESFDRVASIGMIEHVGYKNYRRYMRAVHRCLADDGLFLLQTIGANESTTSTDPWIDKYIFPNGMLPSAKQIAASAEGLFVIEDWHNFGADYDKTLMAWHRNFENNWPSLKERYGERFYRMWRYYLLTCAGAFRARRIQLWQIVFSKKGIAGGYKSVR